MCEPTRIEDKDGGFFLIGDAGDVWFPPFPLNNSYTEQLDIIKNAKIRDDDVVMAGYGKSGSHWHFEIVSMLQRGGADYVRQSKAHEMIDKLSQAEIDDLGSPRVLNTHVPLRHFPREAIDKKTKILLLVRNPKDVAVSMFNHMSNWTRGGYTGTWENFLDLFLESGVWYGNWFKVMLDWEREMEKHPELPIFISSYEDMHKVGGWVGPNWTGELCAQIAEKCQFSQLKQASSTVKVESFPPGIWKKGSPGFFRKGEVGDWKNWFTPEQNRKFDQVYHSNMKDSKLNIVFEL